MLSVLEGILMPRKKPQAKAKAPRSLPDRLLDALGTIDRPGTFCTSGDLPLVMPGLEVNGLGAVRLPLGQTQARQLVNLSHAAREDHKACCNGGKMRCVPPSSPRSEH